MESFIAIADFAKANGIGATIPVAVYIIAKVVREDMRERALAVKVNDSAIRELQVAVASMKATIEAIVSKNY